MDSEVTRLRMAIRNQAIFISTEDVQGDVVLRMYDIADVIKPVRDFPGIELSFTSGDEVGGGFSFDLGDEPEEATDPSEIEDFVRDSIAADTWDELPGVSIVYRAGSLFVSHTPEVHDQVANLLTNLRNQRSLQVNMQIVCWTFGRVSLRKLASTLKTTNGVDTPIDGGVNTPDTSDPQARHSSGDNELTYGNNPILPDRASGEWFCARHYRAFVQPSIW